MLTILQSKTKKEEERCMNELLANMEATKNHLFYVSSFLVGIYFLRMEFLRIGKVFQKNLFD